MTVSSILTQILADIDSAIEEIALDEPIPYDILQIRASLVQQLGGDSEGGGGGTVTPNNIVPVSRSGTTSASPSVWTQLMAANSARKTWSIQNISASDMELGYGAAGSEFTIAKLIPGAQWYESGSDIILGRIVVRCSVASQSYIAWES